MHAPHSLPSHYLPEGSESFELRFQDPKLAERPTFVDPTSAGAP